MRIEVDYEACDGNALCEGAAPQVFRVDENGDLHLLVEQPGEELRAHVLEAELVCPTQAIVVSDD